MALDRGGAARRVGAHFDTMPWTPSTPPTSPIGTRIAAQDTHEPPLNEPPVATILFAVAPWPRCGFQHNRKLPWGARQQL